MSLNFNQVNFGGRVTRDIEFQELNSGTLIAKFSMVSNHKWGEKETACFIECVLFGKQAKTLYDYSGKGQELLVTGRLEQDQWEDRDTGAKRSKHVIVVESYKFVGSKDSNGGGEQAATPSRRPTRPNRPTKPTAPTPNPDYDNSGPPEDDQIPF